MFSRHTVAGGDGLSPDHRDHTVYDAYFFAKTVEKKATTVYGMLLQPRPTPLIVQLRRHRGRTASYPTAPAQIPACSFPAPGSSGILASAIRPRLLKLPSLLLVAQLYGDVLL